MHQQQFEFVPGSRAEIEIDPDSLRVDDVNNVIVARFPGETSDMGYSIQFETSMWHTHFGALKDRPTVQLGKPWKVAITVDDWGEVTMGSGVNAETYTALQCPDGIVVVRGIGLQNIQKYKLVRDREPTVMEKANNLFSERRSLRGA